MDIAYGTIDESSNFDDHLIKKSSNWITGVSIAITFVVICFVGLVYNNKIFTYDHLKKDSQLSFTVSTSYGIHDSTRFPYPWLSDALFVENYKFNNFYLDNPTSGCSYVYEINGVSDSSFSISGSSEDGQFTFEPTSTGEYVLNVNEYCNNELTRSLEQTIWSKYVRRELSALSDEDREDFLDAFATLWAVKSPEGKELYGEDYKSLYHFAIVHNDAGSNPICDQFHTGSGFINNHMYLGSYLEQVLRLVNPRVSLHYMEYGAYFSSDDFSNHQNNQLDGGAWSEIFTDKFFGTNDPYTGKITNGRWADFTLPYLTDEFIESEGLSSTSTLFSYEEEEWLEVADPHMRNPFGLLRAPWNYSPANYTLRFNNVNLFNSYSSIKPAILNFYDGVDCDDYAEFFDEVSGNPLYTLLTDVEDDVHGKIHFTLGGSGGTHCIETDEYLMETYDFGWKDMVVTAQSSQRFFKNILGSKPAWETHGLDMEYPLACSDDPWQNGILTTTGEPGEDGGPSCTCNSYYFEDSDKLLLLVDAYFRDWVGVKSSQHDTVQMIYDMDFDEQVDVMSRLCGRFQFEGDLAGSGAATDPIFWVVHGGVERLMQKIYFDGTLTDYDYVEVKSTCSGHISSGTKDWLQGYKFEDESIQAELLTNEELAEYLNPLSDLYRDQIDFVYDHSDWTTLCSGEFV